MTICLKPSTSEPILIGRRANVDGSEGQISRSDRKVGSENREEYPKKTDPRHTDKIPDISAIQERNLMRAHIFSVDVLHSSRC